MAKKEKNNSTFKQLKELKADQKEIHEAEVKDVIKETYQGPDSFEQKTKYRFAKSLRWYEILITVIISGIFLMIAFLVDIYAMPGKYFASTMTTILIVFGLLVWLIMGWIKNRRAAGYYNDARRRYLATMTDEEAWIVKIRKLVLIFVIIQVIGAGFSFLI
ncbi:hypothetical protein [Spiroplasma alleghenense]|uniref:Uncharacterized protein n=1 Tax=Spiroplasma alleghenense TaxID=216931 RepID=A0A345Z4G1_9MOLU|nr:hypothetical protein [Spiroplasma alleghenense]AXK51490.1 hypothetical protein SALLE_v1c08200 [Spiroplasma alleghenense]